MSQKITFMLWSGCVLLLLPELRSTLGTTLIKTMSLKIIINLILFLHSRFGLIVAHPDLDWEISRSGPGHNKDFKMVLTAPQPVLVK